MKTQLCFLLIVTLCFISCNQSETLYVKTSTADIIESKTAQTDSVLTVNTDYFQIDLKSVNKGKYYIASKQIAKPTSNDSYRSVIKVITNEKGEPEHFKS